MIKFARLFLPAALVCLTLPASAQEPDTRRWLDNLKPGASPRPTPSPSTDSRLQWYQQQIQAHPKQPALYYQLGLLNEQAGRLDEALKAYDAALALNPRLYPVIYHRSLTLIALKRPTEVQLASTLKVWRVDPDLHYVDGMHHEASQVTGLAIAAYQRALMLNPQHPARERLLALKAPLKPTEAETPQKRLARAQSLHNQKKKEGLAEAVALYIDRPDFAPVYDWLARYHESLGANAEALNLREQAQVLNPCLGENPWLLGRHYYWQGYGNQALEMLERQQQCQPVAAASLLLAQIRLQRAQPELALASLKTAAARWPKDSRIQAILAETHLALNQAGPAQAILTQLLKLRSVPPEAHYVQGQLHLQAGRTGAAVTSLKQALALSNRPEYRKALILAYVQAGMSAPALSEIQRYLQQRPAEAAAWQPLIARLQQQKARGRIKD